VLSIHLIATSFAFFNLANTVAWGSAQACRLQKNIIHNYHDVTVELQNGNGNGRELGQKICSRTSLLGSGVLDFGGDRRRGRGSLGVNTMQKWRIDDYRLLCEKLTVFPYARYTVEFYVKCPFL